MVEERTRREEALRGLSEPVAAELDRWASAEGVGPEDPAWTAVSQIARASEIATEAAESRIESAVNEASQDAAATIKDQLAEHTKRRGHIPRRPLPWLVVGGVQATLLILAAAFGGAADLVWNRSNLAELENQVSEKRETLQYLNTASHGLEVLTYPRDAATYIKLPKVPQHHCDGDPCLRIEASE